MSNRVLLVDNDRPVREALGQTLMLADHEVTTAGSFIEASGAKSKVDRSPRARRK